MGTGSVEVLPLGVAEGNRPVEGVEQADSRPVAVTMVGNRRAVAEVGSTVAECRAGRTVGHTVERRRRRQ